MPAFKQNGVLVWFGAFKNHIGFYPVPSMTEGSKEELSPYKRGKGTLQFPFDEPIPYMCSLSNSPRCPSPGSRFRISDDIG
jgi:uncharacterized protein YdhG (YjbR/CyaY superfamily)